MFEFPLIRPLKVVVFEQKIMWYGRRDGIRDLELRQHWYADDLYLDLQPYRTMLSS